MTSPPETVAEYVRRSCAEQGVPEKITDPAVLRKIAILLNLDRKVMTLGQAWPFPEPPCYHGQACSGTGPDCGPDEDFCWPRLGRHVDPHTCSADYQSWSESEAAESRRHALKRLDEATS